MHFAERDHREFRIYSGARETSGGFVADVAVRRVFGNGSGELPVIYREDGLAGGHCWQTAHQALQYACQRGTEAIDLHMQRRAEPQPG